MNVHITQLSESYLDRIKAAAKKPLGQSNSREQISRYDHYVISRSNAAIVQEALRVYLVELNQTA